MDTFYAIGMRLIIILGSLAAVTALLIYLSCRCFSGWKSVKKFTTGAGYRKFFKTHAGYWWLFGVLVIMHILAVYFYFYSPF
jgi:hypothetical protein